MTCHTFEFDDSCEMGYCLRLKTVRLIEIYVFFDIPLLKLFPFLSSELKEKSSCPAQEVASFYLILP